MLIGNLGADPEPRYLPNGTAVTQLRVATGEKWKDKQTNQPKEHTEWHQVVLFGKTAEIAAQYFKKGSKVYVEGKIKTRKWQDKNGVDRYTTEIIGDQIQGLDSVGKQNPQQPVNQPQQQSIQRQPQQNYQPPPSDWQDIPF